MATTVGINQIITEIEDLNYADKLNILSSIVSMLKKTDIKPHTRLTDLKGLGKDLWRKNNTDAYVAKERESWD